MLAVSGFFFYGKMRTLDLISILPEIWKIKGEVEIVRTQGKNETDNRNASLWEFTNHGERLRHSQDIKN